MTRGADTLGPALLALLSSHRSIRRFEARPIDPLLVGSLVGHAIAGTSSYGNLNCASLVLTSAADRLTLLRALHFDQPTVMSAPAMLTVCADTARVRAWLALNEAADNFRNLQGFMVAVIDAALLAQSVALALEAHGMGICFLGTTLDRCTEIAEFLELPPSCVPITSLAVGYPEEAPLKRDRLPLDAYLHHERYRSPSEEQLAALYSDCDRSGWHRILASGVEATDLDANGVRNFAQYCTSALRYSPEQFEETSVALDRLLRRHGFIP